MAFRVTDSNTNSSSVSRINSHRAQISVLQERLATGKRINRPSDDPFGAEAVINIRTSQNEIRQFKRNAEAVNLQLSAADESIGSYQNLVDRIKTLISQGLSDTTTQEGRNSIATEIESLRERVLSVANQKYDGEYLFGGVRQSEPPYDPTTGLPSALPTGSRYVQIEPGTNAIATGVTADTFLSDSVSDIFSDLDAAVTALRGTGDPVADRAALQNSFARAEVYSDLSNSARSRIGATVNITESAIERLSEDFLTFDQRASNIEGADFAETVVELTESQSALEATLQMIANGRRSLFDYLR